MPTAGEKHNGVLQQLSRSKQNLRDAGRFRIIGGQWRGRRFSFPASADIRPTPDRVRETLFNWLQPVITGARCLDLYAGSGALGLEALSRGAAGVVFVDRERRVLDAVRAHLDQLGCNTGRLEQAEALQFLQHCRLQFDVVMLDPPFDAQPWQQLFAAISNNDLLVPGGQLYFEMPARDRLPELPADWQLRRSGRASRVGYHLVSRPRCGD